MSKRKKEPFGLRLEEAFDALTQRHAAYSAYTWSLLNAGKEYDDREEEMWLQRNKAMEAILVLLDEANRAQGMRKVYLPMPRKKRTAA